MEERSGGKKRRDKLERPPTSPLSIIPTPKWLLKTNIATLVAHQSTLGGGRRKA